VVRMKDRLSRTWDADKSGGNRDVLINGTLHMPDGTTMVVEIQLHVRALYTLKHNLHTIYKAMRVLDAEAEVEFQGELSVDALRRAERGIVRAFECKQVCIEPDVFAAMAQMLQTEGLTLTKFTIAEVSNKDTCWGENSLSALFVPPSGKVACRRLKSLDLTSNYMPGSLPLELGDMPRLFRLALSSNRLTGPIPESIGRLVRLQFLNLSFNQLSGPIPESIGSLTQLRNLQLSGNQLTGPIPESIGRLVQLMYLNISRNQLTGPIPESIGSLVQLQMLYLQSNKLAGPIPESFVRAFNASSRSTKASFQVDDNPDLHISPSGEEALRKKARFLKLCNVMLDDMPDS